MIFDWDGTLVDSQNQIVQAMQGAIDDAGLPGVADNDIARLIGLSLVEAISRLYPSQPQTAQKYLLERYSHNFVEISKHSQGNNYFPNVESTLEQLSDAGHVLAVATGKSRRGLERVFGHDDIADFFTTTRTADETLSKPDPKMLLEILSETGESVDNAVMIGDTTYDMQMARSINMPRIGVSYGVHSAQELRGYDPLQVLATFDQLLNWY